MLVSAQANLAFAHFPKTAGTSIVELLTGALPDARLIDPADKHLGVGESYLRLGRKKTALASWIGRLKGLPARTCQAEVTAPEKLRVVGVVREPFDMALSLFEYWQRILPQSGDEHHLPLTSAAVRGDFIAFMEILGEDSSRFPTYRQFFDLDGPLWPNTLLVDFAHLKEGLAEAFELLGVKIDLDRLDMINTTPRTAAQRKLRLEQAGDLADKVRRRYDWSRPVRLLGRRQQAGGLA